MGEYNPHDMGLTRDRATMSESTNVPHSAVDICNRISDALAEWKHRELEPEERVTLLIIKFDKHGQVDRMRMVLRKG